MTALTMVCRLIEELIWKMFCRAGVMLTLKGTLETRISLYHHHVIIIIISNTVLEKVQHFFFFTRMGTLKIEQEIKT